MTPCPEGCARRHNHVRRCDGCREVDDLPHHVHVGVQSKHRPCCRADGCPTGQCDSFYADLDRLLEGATAVT